MMSIRLRFTFLYNAILAVTLAVFSVTLYSIQSQSTLLALKKELIRSSETLGSSVLKTAIDPKLSGSSTGANSPGAPGSLTNPSAPGSSTAPGAPGTSTDPGKQPPASEPPPPMPFQTFSDDQAFKNIPEREIVRVLDGSGNLVASPFGRSEDALPLSKEGLNVLQNQAEWWETAEVQRSQMLIYSRPIISSGQVAYILQTARPLTERNNSLQTLGSTLIAASLVIFLAAFGIGWVFSGVTLKPINHITQTAQAIGAERDFTRRVSYRGPQDEVGRLATTFNSMLAGLQEAYQRVARSLDMQRSFVADVSHELRTPLTTLRGNLELLRRTPPIPVEERADILNDMVDESDRLIRLVNELLLLARADAGRNLVSEPIILLPLLEEVNRQMQQIDPNRKIILNIPDGLSMLGDRDAFKQILFILLDNSLKYSEGDIYVIAEQQEQRVKTFVKDYGKGFPADKLAHVFDRFYRGEEAAGVPGFGLGLSIARSLVEAQGGKISISSEMGKGSQVELDFPAP